MARVYSLAVCLAACCLAAPSLAQEGDAGRREPDFVAGGVGFNPEYVGADDYALIPFGAFSFATPFGDVRSSGLAVTANLLAPYQRDRALRFEFGPQINYRFGRADDNVEDPAILALGEIDDSIEAGLTVGIGMDDIFMPGDGLDVRAEALRDTSGVYDGGTYGLTLTYTLATPREWGVNIIANTQYGDDRFHNRYFDVSAEQAAASGLPEFDAKEGFYQVAVGINVRRNITERLFVSGQFVTARLIGDVADSPVVRFGGSEVQLRGGLTLGITF